MMPCILWWCACICLKIFNALFWTDKFGSQLFSQADLLLILDYLVERNLLFAQPSSGTDDIAMKLASFKVIKNLCKPCKCAIAAEVVCSGQKLLVTFRSFEIVCGLHVLEQFWFTVSRLYESAGKVFFPSQTSLLGWKTNKICWSDHVGTIVQTLAPNEMIEVAISWVILLDVPENFKMSSWLLEFKLKILNLKLNCTWLKKWNFKSLLASFHVLNNVAIICYKHQEVR